MCCYYPLNPQVLFYDGHGSHFDDRALDILRRNNIQSFILKVGDSVHDQPHNNVPNMKFKNLYNNVRMNWIKHHGTLKFTPTHINSVLVETWEAFKLSSTTITHKYFKKTPPPSTHWTLAPTKNIVLLVINSKTERKRVMLDV